MVAKHFIHESEYLFFAFSATFGACRACGEITSSGTEYIFFRFDIFTADFFITDRAIQCGHYDGADQAQQQQNIFILHGVGLLSLSNVA